MLNFDIDRLLFPERRKEEERILKKAKEKGVDSLTKEEKKIYEDLTRRMFMA
ncbi:hypothetical protein SAMN04487771_10306 [[Clostridium] aminophilum]|uniref:Uncharacterized protein n=1 Tax=[Clostridium] aminophilum TaxID=1526 RepID=A0A1I0G3U3_9FIRM|nr:hypothetical protein [[Clostridium] aminophilum]SET65260.1 hypothetical protein SAMN04487771_10306 [[Clostridium] aminophilum]